MKELQKAHVGCALRHRYESVTVVTEVNFADQRRHRRRLRVGRAVLRLSEAGDSRNPMNGIARRRKRIRRIRPLVLDDFQDVALLFFTARRRH